MGHLGTHGGTDDDDLWVLLGVVERQESENGQCGRRPMDLVSSTSRDKRRKATRSAIESAE